MKQLQASAFQMDDGALFTIKDGAELVVSGACTVEWKTEFGKAPGIASLIPDAGEAVMVTIRDVDTDPEHVGTPARPGQRRLLWAGVVEVDDD